MTGVGQRPNPNPFPTTEGAGWVEGASNSDYPGYEQIIAGLKRDTFDTVLAHGGAWAGSGPREAQRQSLSHHCSVLSTPCAGAVPDGG